ncbi:DUF3667 domain-containing protein [Cesiribacter sp. SM1]|uniref:DUF3667 domain-containing protein n=1 Tax=Cesiribacter sp. SM1 TaxID=2861196 RepID=UPI001CD73B49|nr:DUF3667 domain-containing protein [Cesiribacter sp. SM1]
MKKLHKQPACLNCNRPLSSTDNFCSGCGQENTKHTISFGTFLHDFFSNYLSFDSRIGRSTVPFLLQPGLLTKKFNEGKRTSFVHPLRLYLIISFVFFFLLSMLINQVVEERKISLYDGKTFSLGNEPGPNEKRMIQAGIDSAQEKLNEKDSTLVQLPDTALIASSRKAGIDFMSLMRNQVLTDEQVLDSLQMDKKSELDRLIVHQGRKVFQKDMDVFIPYLIQNLSIMMFLLLPVFAFFLYVLFWRREKYYISHVIHALHLHSFSFLILALLLFLAFFYQSGLLVFAAFLIVTLYAFFSIKKVYGQGWWRTLLKFNVLGFCYFMTLLFAVMAEVAISFALF